jgi:hypothetical protein
MILQIRKRENYHYEIITYWNDLNHVAQILPSIDKNKLQYAIENNTSYDGNGDYFIQLKK